MVMRYVILGGTGHVGSVVAETLIATGQPVTIVSHDDAKRDAWETKGAEFAVADAHDPGALGQAFGTGNRLYLLNPPAPIDGDTDAEELATIDAIVTAASASAPEWAVAHSTYGAMPGKGCGDSTTLYQLERGLADAGVPHCVLRAAFYFTNWDMVLPQVRDGGALPSMYPADFVLPMVDPVDLGRIGAGLLQSPGRTGALHWVEGPRRYTPADVAAAFAEALGRPVTVSVTPRDRIEQTYRDQGFSDAAARAYACMTRQTLDWADKFPTDFERGEITLETHIRDLVASA